MLYKHINLSFINKNNYSVSVLIKIKVVKIIYDKICRFNIPKITIIMLHILPYVNNQERLILYKTLVDYIRKIREIFLSNETRCINNMLINLNRVYHLYDTVFKKTKLSNKITIYIITQKKNK